MSVLGTIAMLVVVAQVNILGRSWDFHAEIAGSLLVIIGPQVIGMGLCGHAYGMYYMGERDPWFERMRERFRLESGLLLGGGLLVAGVIAAGIIVYRWSERGFGQLGEERLAVTAATLMVVGMQVVFTSFLLSILGLRRER
jgi:hypothetical protein